MSPSSQQAHFTSSNHAIVIGGGIAGLLAARVLTNHFANVTLIERDHYPAEPSPRAGAPQSRHVHILLVRGQQILEDLFPGIKDKLIAQGAIETDFLADYRYLVPAGWLARTPSRLRGYTCTRSLLEWQVHHELLTYDRVHVLEGHEVIDLTASSTGRAVTGVRIRQRSHTAPEASEPIVMAADLVVDASGRDSQAARWLESLGYTPPPETIINPFLGYATRFYAPPDEHRSWKGMLLNAAPPKSLRGGLIWPIEGGHWIVVMAGTGKDYPPTDEEGFLEFARSLLDLALYDALQGAHPISTIYGYRRTENRLRHFERLARLPAGFVALGDAVCAFNPIYGQGMTVATLGALSLDESLTRYRRRDMATLTRYFQKKLAKVNALPWQLAAAADERVVAAQGRKKGWMTRLIYRYFDDINALLPSSPGLSEIYLETLHMIRPPRTLFHPVLALSVLRYEATCFIRRRKL
jgi:2-polyprenyl-6-methoxyphenol hydroxylase-like FAD-dependent oxidoreductase